MKALLLKNPIAAWTGGKHFALRGQQFACLFEEENRRELQGLVSELVDWRLAEYLDRGRRVCKVSHTGGKPIIFLSEPRSDFPTGWTPVWVDGVEHEANFVKVAVNVMRRPGSDDNVLAGILRGWFGERAGAPGMVHQVQLVLDGERWSMRPARGDGAG